MTAHLDLEHRLEDRAAESTLDRPSWWSQVLVVVVFAWGYDELRSLHGNVRDVALHHGRQVLDVDRWLGFGAIEQLSRWVGHHEVTAEVLSVYYVVMHLGGAALMLVILWFDGRYYRWYRDALIAINVAAFAIFWIYPTAPPRLLGLGYGDAVRQSLPFAYHAEASAANLYAAMPSLHAAWALWVSLALWRLSRRRWVRVLAVAHTLVTAVAVLATGNHYMLDVAAGLALTAIVLATMRLRWIPGPTAPDVPCC